MNADFLYFFCSSCAKFLCGSDTSALSISYLSGEGPAAVAAERGTPVVLHSWCFPAALWAGQHLGLQWRAAPPLLCFLLCAIHVTVPLLVLAWNESPPPEICH